MKRLLPLLLFAVCGADWPPPYGAWPNPEPPPGARIVAVVQVGDVWQRVDVDESGRTTTYAMFRPTSQPTSQPADPNCPACPECPPPARPCWEPGDLNCDGTVDFRDINAITLRLSSPAAWATEYPQCGDQP